MNEARRYLGDLVEDLMKAAPDRYLEDSPPFDQAWGLLNESSVDPRLLTTALEDLVAEVEQRLSPRFARASLPLARAQGYLRREAENLRSRANRPA